MRRVLALAALLIESAAVPFPAAAQTDASQPDWLEQAKIVAKMQGITVGEAVRRARLLAKVNSAIKRFESDPDYAGAWIDQDARHFTANFAFRDGRRAAIEDTELRDVSAFPTATRSMADLAQARASLAKTLRQHGLKGAVSVDPRTQRMSLYPDEPDKLRALLSAGTVTIPDFIDVKNGPLTLTPEYDVYGAGSMDVRTPLGNTINCTGGFIVTDGRVRGIATAGHCQDPGYSVQTHWSQPVGQFMGAVYRDDGKGLDIAWFRNSAYTYLNRVRISPTSYYAITSAGPLIPANGTVVCIVKRDQTQPCGYVQTYFYRMGPDGTYSNGPFIQVDRDLAVGSDSGGPWLYGGAAYGVHYGNTLYAGVNHDFFTSVGALPRMGLSVVTQ
jgi:streptogrisin C